MFRIAASALVLAALAWSASAGVAFADPPPWAHGRLHFQGTVEPAHDVISGTIAGVNYETGTILVATPHGLVPIGVSPSTSIIRGSHYAALSDIGRGARVDVDVAPINGRLVAQIIRIR